MLNEYYCSSKNCTTFKIIKYFVRRYGISITIYPDVAFFSIEKYDIRIYFKDHTYFREYKPDNLIDLIKFIKTLIYDS